ncbi:DUF4157 domain-containing protein [Amycolatopsis sp. NPDC059027]|uniref:eCIS core domain-containing protein n=1 Tax=unclassified Amycolatopsis TaxID=2618356 RepID=UPI00367031F2
MRHDGTKRTKQANEPSTRPAGREPVAEVPQHGPALGDFVDTPVHGTPLPGDVRREMEHAFDADLSRVRLGGAPETPGVVASASGEFVRVTSSPGQPREERRLLAHELAHVLQQRHGAERSPGDTGSLEREAHDAAELVLSGSRATVRGAAPRHAVQHATLAERVQTAKSKGEVFDALRAGSEADRKDPAVLTAVEAKLAGQPDDLWLARTIIAHGAEPLWDAKDLTERSDRARKGNWAPEAGNIEAGQADPDPDPSRDRQIQPIKIYLFPGRNPDQRVLVLGGVHGDEPEGREVVERLRTRLAKESAAGNPPAFTTILVPELISLTHREYGLPERPQSGRYVPAGRTRKGGGELDPNRNYPLPGETYAQARERGKSGGAELVTHPIDRDTGETQFNTPTRPPEDFTKTKDGKKKSFNTSSIRLLPETRALIKLMERFKPTRIVSVHSHSLTSKIGDAPGVFVDPRGTDPNTGKLTDPKAAAADDALTQELLAKTRSHARDARPSAFAGNAPRRTEIAPNVHYSSSEHAEGNSLGMYGPVATAERPAATTITVELPKLTDKAELDKLVDAHVAGLDEVILREP